MAMTENGISTTANGREQYEKFRICGRQAVQYDYRTDGARLFSCVRPTLEACRAARDRWLAS